MLSGPRQNFCEGIVAGKNATDAYVAAYPKITPEAARRAGSRLLTIGDITSEIARLRKASEAVPGHAVLTLAAKRSFLARLVNDKGGEIDACKVALSDKLKAIALDNDLAGEGSEAKGSEGLAALILRLRK